MARLNLESNDGSFHEMLCKYFVESPEHERREICPQPWILAGTMARGDAMPNARKLRALPYHMMGANRWDALVNQVCAAALSTQTAGMASLCPHEHPAIAPNVSGGVD